MTTETGGAPLRLAAGLADKPAGTRVTLHGMLHAVRDMKDFAFLILRLEDGLVQCVYDTAGGEEPPPREESAVRVSGALRPEARAVGGVELVADALTVLSAPHEALPVPVGKRRLNLQIETELTLRPVTLRNDARRAVFKLREGLVRGMRRHLEESGFTEIFTPKLVSAGAEGGSNLFGLEYFGKKAFLAQSPQAYKQMLIPVYGRVFEIGPVFRAEKHNTPRHLSEYISVDFEMGFIESFYDILREETDMLRGALAMLAGPYAGYARQLGVTLPEIGSEIPCLRFAEAKERVAARYGRKIRNPFDLEPEEERLIGRLALEEYGSDFVFVTHYPAKKRPFYAMDDPEDPRYTLSFDLLFRGLEVTTGGQRIHDFAAQTEKMRAKGLDPADFESYLMLHRYGCPPHGGLGLGLERLLLQLLGEQNVRAASMFPRDTTRLEP
ncbi:MAG: aspartate--tRNA(Asn) ligase [Oscillospiraceae bacterium]|jgi:nondiscriminating aspartyl-tRNA synthetase|nr:aspartate--tRNA(Asn) ligase [Oscillospiraceae bacterium]